MRLLLVGLLVSVLGLSEASTSTAETRSVPVEAFEEQLQETLSTLEPGDRVVLPEGRFVLSRPLTLAVRDVRVEGRGSKKTILDFSAQKQGGQSWIVVANGVEIAGLRLVNPPADGLVVRGARGFGVRDVAVEWTGPPSSKNGGYGIYPVNSSDVTIDHCYVRGASEAGIYVGQSVDGVVRGNTVEGNVVGIDIENSVRIRAEKNIVRGNSVGIVVSARPKLFQPQSLDVHVLDNEVEENNLKSFAKADTYLSRLGEGRGVAIIGGTRSRVASNRFRDHASTHILLLNYTSLGLAELRDPLFSPNLDGTRLAGNLFDNPTGPPTSPAKNWKDARGFDIVWDGMVTARPTKPHLIPVSFCREDETSVRYLDLNARATVERNALLVPKCQ